MAYVLTCVFAVAGLLAYRHHRRVPPLPAAEDVGWAVVWSQIENTTRQSQR